VIIYVATNKVNEKSYVGQTRMSLRQRFYKHKHDAKMGATALFHRAIRKYGLSSFDIQQVSETKSNCVLNNLEKLWVILLQSENPSLGYNLTAGGEGGLPTQEIRKKMSQKKLSDPVAMERVRQLGLASCGRKASPELRKILREANSGSNNGFFGKKHSEETKRKSSEAQKKRYASGEAKATSYWAGKKFSEEHKAKLKKSFDSRPKDSKGRLMKEGK
jgi:group I intron endonuclease